MKARILMGILIFTLSLLSVASGVNLGQFRIIIPVIPPPGEIMEITAGDYHTCIRKYNGDVYCWGRTDRGQVGTWSINGVVNVPTHISSGAAQVDAGANHTCTVNFGGGASCWGDSSFGQLGTGNGLYGYQTQPLPVAGGLTFSTIGAGKHSTCGTTTTGLYCWGNIMNDGTGVALPVQLIPSNAYRSVTVGHTHLCALYASGNWREVNCWGKNNFGQLASDPAQGMITPWPLPTLFGYSVSRVTTQTNFTCVDQTWGVVQCAGDNIFGQIGNGQIGGSTFQPQNVGGGMALRGVSTGPGHACALDPSNRAYCWGNGNRGQLGNNTWSYSGLQYIYGTPQPVLGGLTFRAIATGQQHTCGVTTDNRVYCWGDNALGQLGLQYTGGYTASPAWPAI